ncbi:MAG: hypothetical protein ABFS56_08665 [Pseudomonadota bacterium]
MKDLFKFDSSYSSHYTRKPRRNKSRFWFVLILLLAVGGYFAVPKILKSRSQADPEAVIPSESDQAADEKIIKIIPLPKLDS